MDKVEDDSNAATGEKKRKFEEVDHEDMDKEEEKDNV